MYTHILKNLRQILVLAFFHKGLERTIEEVAGTDQEIQLLMSIPGVGYFTSLLIKSEIGDISRFPSTDLLVSYAVLDPSGRHSGNKEIRGEIKKEGSAPPRWALVQCANVAVWFEEYLGNFYTQLEERRNHQIAIIATGRKMLVSIFYMPSKEEVSDPNISD
jgi:transposase